MAGNGFIKIHRKLLDNPIFSKPELLQLFLYCLLQAKHTPAKEFWGKTERIIERGQFTTGRFKIASDLKCNSSSAYKRLQKLKNLNFINTESNNEKTLITIVNYEIYQGAENKSNSESNNEVTTREQRNNNAVTHTKNIKNIKEKEIYKEKEKVEQYTDNPDLQKAIYDYIEMRKEKKKAPTENALTLILKKADKLASTPKDKIEVFNQSTRNGWTDIYPVKVDEAKEEKPKCSICNGTGIIKIGKEPNIKFQKCKCKEEITDKVQAITQNIFKSL